MTNQPQGPGWWQASDGNWYPPQQQSGYAPPPPQAPMGPPGYRAAGQTTGTPMAPPPAQPWSPPAAGPQYSAAGGQPFSQASAAFTSGAAKLPLPAWLLYGGLAVALISIFLPWATVSAEGILTLSVPLDDVSKVGDFLLIAVSAWLVWVTFAQPQKRWAQIILTVLVGILVIDMIIEWASLGSAAGDVRDTPGVSVSPSVGILLYTAAVSFLAVRIVFLFISRSKSQPPAV